jgi:hypothetical protein
LDGGWLLACDTVLHWQHWRSVNFDMVDYQEELLIPPKIDLRRAGTFVEALAIHGRFEQ